MVILMKYLSLKICHMSCLMAMPHQQKWKNTAGITRPNRRLCFTRTRTCHGASSEMFSSACCCWLFKLCPVLKINKNVIQANDRFAVNFTSEHQHTNFFCPQKKLREGNIFTGVCLGGYVPSNASWDRSYSRGNPLDIRPGDLPSPY